MSITTINILCSFVLRFRFECSFRSAMFFSVDSSFFLIYNTIRWFQSTLRFNTVQTNTCTLHTYTHHRSTYRHNFHIFRFPRAWQTQSFSHFFFFILVSLFHQSRWWVFAVWEIEFYSCSDSCVDRMFIWHFRHFSFSLDVVRRAPKDRFIYDVSQTTFEQN